MKISFVPSYHVSCVDPLTQLRDVDEVTEEYMRVRRIVSSIYVFFFEHKLLFCISYLRIPREAAYHFLLHNPSLFNHNTREVDTGLAKTVLVTDVDNALKFSNDEGAVDHFNGIDEKKLVRKTDWMVMPLLFLTDYLQYTDRTLGETALPKILLSLIQVAPVSYAAVMGIRTDNKIDTNLFSYLALTFYVTFLFFELPNSRMIQHFPTAKYLGINGCLKWFDQLE